MKESLVQARDRDLGSGLPPVGWLMNSPGWESREVQRAQRAAR